MPSLGVRSPCTGDKHFRKILGLCVWCFDIFPAPSEKNLPLKGPRKSKCMAFYDRVVEGTTFEWTICNNGRAEPEEAKGNSFYVK